MLKIFIYKIVPFFRSHKKTFIALLALLIIISITKIYLVSHSTDSSEDDYEDYFDSSTKLSSFHIPKKIFFVDERVPTSDSLVRSSIEKELIASTNWKAEILLLNKRAAYWFPLIEPILKANKVPDDFKYIALIESQLTNVISKQGATGFWQLVESTAKQYGLEITNEVDERYHVEKATQAACLYFKEAYKKFNNWTLVAASYNLGISGVQSQLEKQKATTFYKLKLTSETAKYIYRIIAMKEIISRPKVYGSVISKKNRYTAIETKKIKIDSTIQNLTDFALKQKTDFKILKLFNPWLRSYRLTNANRKTYIIEIPKGIVKSLDILMDSNTSFTDTVNIIKKDTILLQTPEKNR